MTRALWKGWLKLAEVTVPVALYAAASTSDRVTFHTLNRATGHRINRQFVDAETGAVVDRDAQVKGYEVAPDDFILLDPEEIAAAIPDSDKTLTIEHFIPCTAVDDVYFDKPYYLAPASKDAAEPFALLVAGLRARKVAALAQTVLFRRFRTMLIRPNGAGLVGTTLNFDYEVRPASEALSDAPKVKIEGEMLDLAKHIIDTKKGTFDPATFDDRYDAALAELVKAKIEGRKVKPRPAPKVSKQSDLLAALRQSAGVTDPAPKTVKKPARNAPAKKPAADKPAEKPKRKAG